MKRLTKNQKPDACSSGLLGALKTNITTKDIWVWCASLMDDLGDLLLLDGGS